MARIRTQTKDTAIERAMLCFWQRGFAATSIDELVRTIGISRHSLYGDFGGKEELFVACLDTYSRDVVTPAFAQVEEARATLEAVAQYFEFQIARGEDAGFPGPGCLMANVMTEVAPHNPTIAAIIDTHNERLRHGFSKALQNTAKSNSTKLGNTATMTLATILVVFANGLWSMSRVVTSAAPLRSAVREQLRLIDQRITT